MDYCANTVDYSIFISFAEAYHKFIMDLTEINIESIKLVVEKNKPAGDIYISGGFARNSIYVKLIASSFPESRVYTSEIDNSSALGAAMVLMKNANIKPDLGLREWKGF